MKSVTILILISFCLGVASCEQDKTENSYCVNIVQDSPATVVLAELEMDTIKFLFDHNHMDYSKYEFYRLQHDELGYHHVRCNQFVNGLKLFTDDLIFHFDQDDKYSSLSGAVVDEIDLSSTSSMNYSKVVEKFLYLVEHDETFFGNKDEIIKSCFDLEFGYFDLNAGISYSDVNFTKAWKIKPTNKDYPFAYINDVNSEIIGYDNGIRY